MTSTTELGDHFADEVLAAYRDLGYSAQPNVNLGGHAIDVTAIGTMVGFGPVRLAIECKTARENVRTRTGKDEATKWAAEVADLRRANLIDAAVMVSRLGFTRAAKEVLDHNSIKHLTLDELKLSAIPFEPFAVRYASEYDEWSSERKHLFVLPQMESSDLSKQFVSRCGRLTVGATSHSLDNLDEFFLRTEAPIGWIRDPGTSPRRLALVADFGSGKTSYLLHLLRLLCDRWLSDRSWPIPIYVPMGDYPDFDDIAEVLLRECARQGIDIKGGTESLLRLFRAGRVVLLLDGIDETTTQGNLSQACRRFEKIAGFGGGIGKALVTCRRTLFRDAGDEVRARIGGPTPDSLLIDAMGPSFSLLELEEFGPKDVTEFVRRSSSHPEDLLRIISWNENLSELCRTPVFLSMIVRLKKEVLSLRASPATLYESFVQSWIEHENKSTNSLGPGEKRLLVEELAFAMNQSQRNDVTRDVLLRLLAREPRLSHQALEWAEQDIRNCTFLTRDRFGTIRFLHKSIQAFLLAKSIARRVKTAESVEDLADALGDECVGERLYLKGGGHWEFLRSLLSREEICQGLAMCRGKSLKVVGYAATNLLAIALYNGMHIIDASRLAIHGLSVNARSLNDVDLTGTALAYSSFGYCTFTRVSLRRARFEETTFRATSFDDVDFDGADLSGLDFDPGIHIKSIAQHDDWVMVGSFSGWVQYFKGGRLQRQEAHHHGVVASIEASRSGLAVTAGYTDRLIRVSDISSGVAAYEFDYGLRANSVAASFDPLGRFLAHAELFGQVNLVDTGTWKTLWSRDFGKYLLWIGWHRGNLLVATSGNVVSLNATTGEPIFHFPVGVQSNGEFALSGDLLAVGGGCPDGSEGVTVHSIPDGKAAFEWKCSDDYYVSALGFVDSRRVVAAACPSGFFGLRDAAEQPPDAESGSTRPRLFVIDLERRVVGAMEFGEMVSAMCSNPDRVLLGCETGVVYSMSPGNFAPSPIISSGAFAKAVSLTGAGSADDFEKTLRRL